MKPDTFFQKILVVIISILLVFTVFFQVVLPSRHYQSANSTFYSLSSYIKYFLITNPLRTLGGFSQDLANLKNAQIENESLRNNLIEVGQLQALIVQLQQDNARLLAQLALTDTYSSFKIINATTIDKDAESYQQILLINQGANQGVSKHMAVMDHQGLIGQVSEVHDNSAVVQLLTNPLITNQFGVKVQIDAQTSIEALLESYHAETKTFTVKLLDPSVAVSIGNKIVTSGLGNIVPQGLLVGEVVEIGQSPSTLSVSLKVKPASDFSNLDYVSVISK